MSPRDSAAAKVGTEIATMLHEQFSRLMRQLRILELPQGMTPERLSALSVIDKQGPISVTALADREMVRPATMSRMVSALVDEGLVKRSEDESDGRGVLVTMTPKGRRAYQRAQSQRLEQFAKALNSLSEDQLASIQSLTSQLETFALLLDGALSELTRTGRGRRGRAVENTTDSSRKVGQRKRLTEEGDIGKPLGRPTRGGRDDDS